MFFRTGLLLSFSVIFTVSTSIQRKTCPLNEKPTNCVEYCAPTCDKPKSPVCTFSCRSGCNCKEGFIRETTFGKCVEISSCVNPEEIRRNYTEPCKENEVITECFDDCEPNCQSGDRVACAFLLWCPRGCVCKHGYIRKTAGGVCVPKNSC